MVNLIGSGKQKPILKPNTESKIYWYGKTENRPGRKLGHINAVAPRPKTALNLALKGARQCQV